MTDYILKFQISLLELLSSLFLYEEIYLHLSLSGNSQPSSAS